MIKTLTIEEAFAWAIKSSVEIKRMGKPAPPPIITEEQQKLWWSAVIDK